LVSPFCHSRWSHPAGACAAPGGQHGGQQLWRLRPDRGGQCLKLTALQDQADRPDAFGLNEAAAVCCWRHASLPQSAESSSGNQAGPGLERRAQWQSSPDSPKPAAGARAIWKKALAGGSPGLSDGPTLRRACGVPWPKPGQRPWPWVPWPASSQRGASLPKLLPDSSSTLPSSR
jgi:hypothetical protein